MIIVGCDYHPSFQQIAFVDTETGELKSSGSCTARGRRSSTVLWRLRVNGCGWDGGQRTGTLVRTTAMQKKPLVGIGAVADELKLSIPTVTVALDHLVRLGIAKEVTGKRRARIFGYSRYLKILSEGTEPIHAR